MNKVKGFFQQRKLWKRPFDFYAAVLLFLAGLFGIVNDDWPETLMVQPLEKTFIAIVSIYLMFAAGLIMASLWCRKASKPVFSLMGELYGWMFIAAGSVATSLLYLGGIINDAPNSWWTWSILFSLWVGMAIASFIRFFDLLLIYRSLRK